MKFRWAFCIVVSAVWLIGVTVLPQVWLESEKIVPQAFDFFFVLQNAFEFLAVFSALVFAGIFVYAFSALPTERQQSYLVSCIPVVLSIGMILSIGVPVRSNSACGNKHSIAPLALSPILLSDPHLRAAPLTYDFDAPTRSFCD